MDQLPKNANWHQNGGRNKEETALEKSVSQKMAQSYQG